jgi:hypothetical protein
MPEVRLFDRQKAIVRDMVAAFEKAGTAEFMIFHIVGFDGVIFDVNGDDGSRVACSAADLLMLDKAGLISIVSRDSGSLEPLAVELVRQNFSAPTASPPVTIGSLVQNVHGGSMQNVIGNGANQSIHTAVTGVLAQLRSSGVPQPERNEIENLMDEYAAAGPQQKPSIMARFNAWCARNSGNIGEFAGGLLKGYFGDGS